MSGARGGRLPQDIDAAMQALNASVDVDRELWQVDIRGSVAHARGLAEAGVISAAEADEIVDGLQRIARQIEAGEFVWEARLEDVHMNIEARLIELVGPVGGKLHTGRSRNDQVATDLRLWARERCEETLRALAGLAGVIVSRAEDEMDTLMPAYTHLQRGQPSRLSHHLLAWEQMLWRDRGRLHDAMLRLNECPLGAGAAAGTGFPIDREAVARELGFQRAMKNSLDATASRDFLLELASDLAILGVHLSRMAEEIVIWSTQEFGFLTLSDAFATSSSMMPQKKNPDVAELVRGKSARLLGSATALVALEKSLPLGYDRDLQEDKRPVFDAFSDVLLCLWALAGALRTCTFERTRLRGALERGHVCATDLADYLVGQGVPFREAHGVVGGLVRAADAAGVELGGLSADVLRKAHPSLGGSAARSVFEPEAAVERRAGVGGPARARVMEAVLDARQRWQTGPATGE